jgi:hypothetical protein
MVFHASENGFFFVTKKILDFSKLTPYNNNTNTGVNMKSYLITINTRDGEYEYVDKTILELTDEQADSPSEILSLWRGFDDKPKQTYISWYEFGGLDYRQYQVYHIQKIEAEHARILRLYGIY